MPKLPIGSGGRVKFFSAVEKAIENATRKRGVGKAWLNEIMKGPNVKKEELVDTGMDKFLAEQKKELTKDEVLSAFKDRKIDVVEERLGFQRDNPLQETFSGRPEYEYMLPGAPINTDTSQPKGKVETLLYARQGRPDPQGVQKDPNAPYESGHFGSHGEGLMAHERARTAPLFSKEQWDTATQNIPKVVSDPERFQPLETDDTQTRQLINELRRIAGRANTARTANVVVPDAENALFIEETQSDLHQAGRSKGYGPGEEYHRARQGMQDKYNEIINWLGSKIGRENVKLPPAEEMDPGNTPGVDRFFQDIIRALREPTNRELVRERAKRTYRSAQGDVRMNTEGAKGDRQYYIDNIQRGEENLLDLRRSGASAEDIDYQVRDLESNKVALRQIDDLIQAQSGIRRKNKDMFSTKWRALRAAPEGTEGMQEGENLKALYQQYAENVGLMQQHAPGPNVPQAHAPFKESWERLLAKRAIADAVNKGFSAVGWTKGKEAAQRYIGDRPMDQPIPNQPQLERIRSGMQEYYDKTLPNIMKNLVGKYGGEVDTAYTRGQTYPNQTQPPTALPVWKATIPEKLAEELLKNGWPLYMIPPLLAALRNESE